MSEISICTNIPTLIIFSFTLLAIGVCLFLIGYFIGKQSVYGVYHGTRDKPKSFFDNNKEAIGNKNITIDNSKFVTSINTEHMEKKYSSLGDVKESEENITGSINKLKNLKG